MDGDQCVDQWRERKVTNCADENRQRDQEGRDFQEPGQSVVRFDKRPPEYQQSYGKQEISVGFYHREFLLIFACYGDTAQPRTATLMAATSIFCISIIASNALRHNARRDLPRPAPFVLAPAARALRAAVADDRVPITVGLRLVVGCSLKRERLAVLERFSAVEAKAWHAAHRELNRQDIAPVAAGIVGRRPVYGADRAVGKGPGVKARSVFRVMVEPQADRDATLHAAGEPESTVLFARGSHHSYAPQCVHLRTSRRPRTLYAVNP